MKIDIPFNYQMIVAVLKEKIHNARQKAAFNLNAELLSIYHEIGKAISEQEKNAGWGAKVVDKLSMDLRLEFPDMKGLSPRNLRYMRDFALAHPNFPFLQAELAKGLNNDFSSQPNAILQGVLAKLTWYHHITLLDKVKDEKIRTFYIQETVQNGWTRDVMVHQIEAGLHKSRGRLVHNFKKTVDQSDLVAQVFKDPYKFDFIYLGKEAKERDLEEALSSQLTKVLLELGQNFAFMGRQYKVSLGEKEFFFDLLFYHTKLKRHVVVDLKIGEFMAEYVGKMNFYLTIADEQLKDVRDEESIGLILCKTKDGLVAEYALRNTNKAIGISEYKVIEKLPADIRGELPTIEEIEQNMEAKLKNLEDPSHLRLQKILEKLTSIQKGELKSHPKAEILSSLFDRSLKPLFLYLSERVQDLNKYFLDTSHYFYLGRIVADLKELEELWKKETNVRLPEDVFLFIHLNGLKKAGVEAFDISANIKIKLHKYHYGVVLANLNRYQPLRKKLYSQDLTYEEIREIGNIFHKYIVDQIEIRVEEIYHENEDVSTN
jgi:predicted nuclease of restriction endonuclease-like (RecB) superfamily